MLISEKQHQAKNKLIRSGLFYYYYLALHFHIPAGFSCLLSNNKQRISEKQHQARNMMVRSGLLLSALHFHVPGSGVTQTVNAIGLHETRKCNHNAHIKVVGAFIVSSSKNKSAKKTRKGDQKPKTSYLRTNNVSRKEKEIDSLNNSANLDSRDKLLMVDKSGSSYAEVIAKKDSPQGPGRDAVLRACVVTSGIFAAIALTIRQVSHIASEAGLPFPDCAEAMPYTLEWSQAKMIAVLVVLISSCRQLLLIFWPDFAKSSKAANQQVLGSLDTWDYVVVSFFPGISEELLFRGGLLPLIGLDWKGMTVAGITFGALHLGGGRKYAFALWASFVGTVYGFAAISSSSIIVPIAAHSLNNLIGGLLWRYLYSKETAKVSSSDST